MNRKSFLKSIGVAAVAGPSIVKAEKKPVERVFCIHYRNGDEGTTQIVSPDFLNIKPNYINSHGGIFIATGPGHGIIDLGHSFQFGNDKLLITAYLRNTKDKTQITAYNITRKNIDPGAEVKSYTCYRIDEQ